MKFLIIPPFKADELASKLNPATTLGIEVTVPVIASRCGLGNIDHHRPGDDDSTPSACQQAMKWKLPPNASDITLVGVLGDADTLTAMAVLSCRQEGRPGSTQIVNTIGLLDRYGLHSILISGMHKASLSTPVKAIYAIAGRRDLSCTEQVDLIKGILTGGELDEDVWGYLNEHEEALITARANSQVDRMSNGVVVVQSSHQMATQIGYEHGDVLICVNALMPKDPYDPKAGTYLKYTVCKRDARTPWDIDFDQLNRLEPGWGGRPTIGGSPQGKSSRLSISQVHACIRPHK